MPSPTDPVLEDRLVAMGLPPTEHLLDELDAMEPKLRKKAGVALLVLLFLDPTIAAILWQVGGFMVSGMNSLALPIAMTSTCAVLAWASLKSKTSLLSLYQDRKSLLARVDARLAEREEDDV